MKERFVSAVNELALEIETFARHFDAFDHDTLERDEALTGATRLTEALVALEGVRRDLAERLLKTGL